MAKSSAYVRKIYDYFKDKDWQNFDGEKMKEHLAFLKENEVRGVNVDCDRARQGRQRILSGFKTTMSSYEDLLGKGQANAVPFSATHGSRENRGA